MNLPKSFFEAGTYNLTVVAKNNLKDLIKRQYLSGSIDLVGYTPSPDSPYPFPPPIWWWKSNVFNYSGVLGHKIGPPWPEPCVNCGVFNSSNIKYPVPSDINPWPFPLGPLVSDLVIENLVDRMKVNKINKNSFGFYNVMQKENIVSDALVELSQDLSQVQKEISVAIKKLS